MLLLEISDLQKSGIDAVAYRAEYSPSPRKTRDGIPKEKWMNVVFKKLDKEKWERIKAKEKLLSDMGIYFDRLIGGGEIEWQVDWSFMYTEPKEKEELPSETVA